MTNDIAIVEAFKKAFNGVVERITSFNCPTNCYKVFEGYLRAIGVPDEEIQSIYKSSGFENWNEIHEFRSQNEYSIPVHTTIGRIKGLSRTVNFILDRHLEELNSQVEFQEVD